MSVTALNDLFQGFLLAKEANGVRQTTLTTYNAMFRALMRHLKTGHLKDARTITARDLQEWSVWMGKNYATATRDQRIAKAKSFFSWCATNGFLETDPSAGLKRPKADWQPDPFTDDEVDMLLNAAKQGRCGVRDYAIVCLLLDSGIRNSELCGLKVDDLTLKTGRLRIRDGKGGKDRDVFVGHTTKEALWRWMMQKPESCEHLFCTEQGAPFIRTRLSYIVKCVGNKAGFRAYPHRLRHTFALKYLKLGCDPFSLQYILGHEDMTVTRMYVKIASMDASELYKSPLDSIRG